MLNKIRNIEEMENGKDKELMKILKEDAKPFVKRCDGYATKVDEDKEITYKDYNNQELTLKVPKGSYITTDSKGYSIQIVTADDFEARNKIIEHKGERHNRPQIGLALIGE